MGVTGGHKWVYLQWNQAAAYICRCLLNNLPRCYHAFCFTRVSKAKHVTSNISGSMTIFLQKSCHWVASGGFLNSIIWIISSNVFFFKQKKTVSLADVTEPVWLDFSVVAEDNFTFKLFIISSKQRWWRGTTGSWQMLQSTVSLKTIFPSRYFPKGVQVCQHKSASDYKVVAARFTTETLHKVKSDERWFLTIPYYVRLYFDEVGSCRSCTSFRCSFPTCMTVLLNFFMLELFFCPPEVPRTMDCSKSHTPIPSPTTMVEKTLKSCKSWRRPSFLVESSSNTCTLLTDICFLVSSVSGAPGQACAWRGLAGNVFTFT